MNLSYCLRIAALGFVWFTSGCALHYELPEPIINSVSPLIGKEGTRVTINGSTLDSDCTFTINGLLVPIISTSSPTKVIVSLPVGAKTGKIKATNVSGSGLSTEIFEVITPPVIGSFTPSNGLTNTVVTINGDSYGPDLGFLVVYFNGKQSTISQKTNSSIKAIVPSGATSGKITIFSQGGSTTSITDFIVN